MSKNKNISQEYEYESRIKQEQKSEKHNILTKNMNTSQTQDFIELELQN